MFGIDPLEIKKIKRDLTTIETALVALLSHARNETKDEAIKNTCNVAMKGLIRCAIENTQDIVGDTEDVAKKIFDNIKTYEQEKKDTETTPASG